MPALVNAARALQHHHSRASLGDHRSRALPDSDEHTMLARTHDSTAAGGAGRMTDARQRFGRQGLRGRERKIQGNDRQSGISCDNKEGQLREDGDDVEEETRNTRRNTAGDSRALVIVVVVQLQRHQRQHTLCDAV